MITTKMTDVMQQYDSYKDSGVQWLGKIPGHWGCVPFKSMFSLGKGLSITKENLKETGVKVISYGQIHSKQNKYSYIVDELYKFVDSDYLLSSPQCLATKEDFLIADTSEDIEGSGNFVRVDKADKIFAGYHTIIAKNKQPDSGKYMSYLMQSNKWRLQIWCQVRGIKVYSISRAILNSTKFPLPPLSEQTLIVSYLDEKCEKLDKLVEAKEKKIELLGEMKQRVISNAVTRGLNPNVNLKETNIPWLPQVPEHWEVKRAKVYFSNPKVINKDGACNNVLSLTLKGVINNDTDNPIGLSPSSYETYQLFKKNNLVFKLIDLENISTSRVGLVHEDGIMSSAYIRFEIRNEKIALPLYCYYQYYSWYKRNVFNGLGGGVRQTLSGNDLLNIPIPVPPLSEQREIVSYISSRVEKIDTLVSKLRAEIEHIKEYKQRLISDVVTGQIKVS